MEQHMQWPSLIQQLISPPIMWELYKEMSMIDAPEHSCGNYLEEVAASHRILPGPAICQVVVCGARCVFRFILLFGGFMLFVLPRVNGEPCFSSKTVLRFDMLILSFKGTSWRRNYGLRRYRAARDRTCTFQEMGFCPPSSNEIPSRSLNC